MSPVSPLFHTVVTVTSLVFKCCLLQIFLPFMVVFKQMNYEKVSSHNKAMDKGLKPVIAKPGCTNNTYILVKGCGTRGLLRGCHP